MRYGNNAIPRILADAARGIFIYTSPVVAGIYSLVASISSCTSTAEAVTGKASAGRIAPAPAPTLRDNYLEEEVVVEMGAEKPKGNPLIIESWAAVAAQPPQAPSARPNPTGAGTTAVSPKSQRYI